MTRMRPDTTIVSPSQTANSTRTLVTPRPILSRSGALAGLDLLASLRETVMIGNSTGVVVLPVLLIIMQAEKFRLRI